MKKLNLAQVFSTLLEGVAKKLTQAFCPKATFTLRFQIFDQFSKKLYNISFLMSFHALPYEIRVQIFLQNEFLQSLKI